MKRQPGKDMIVFGSGSIVSQLTKHGLIDEYQVAVCPIFLGTGKPMLTGVSKHVRLDLLYAKVSPLGGCLRAIRGRLRERCYDRLDSEPAELAAFQPPRIRWNR